MNTLDELDRRIVAALRRDGRASWRSIADEVASSTATVARRGQQLISSGVVTVAVVPAYGSTGPVDTFLLRLTCRPGTQLSVAEALIPHPDVRFVSVITGEYDIFAEIAVTGGAANYPALLASLQSIEGVERWRSDAVIRLFKSAVSSPAEMDAGLPVCGPDHFDEADRRIIAELRADGRETFQSVADTLGMNESSVRRRFERLRSSSCVDILTIVPAAALGFEVETMFTITVAPSRLDEVAHALAAEPHVRYVASVLDRNALLCEMMLPSNLELYEFLTQTLARFDGVEGWTASMELVFLKYGFIETPWWRAQVDVPA